MAKNDLADQQCPDISDSDIYEAMKEIQGYLDITPSDLKEIYRHALRHAHERINRPHKAAEIMTRIVHHVRVDTPLKDVAETMAHWRISGVPVLDDAGRVAGVISEQDFLSRMGAPDTAHVMGIIAACLGDKGCVATPIRGNTASDIMAAPAITVREETSALEIAEIFAARNINRVPVVDGSGKLAGIVSRADILRAQTAPRE
ncbi:MAG: CBS domain-containing protein [Candidatus Methylomirabilia bacterium]